MARKQPLHLRRISPSNSYALNMRIADAVMDFVEEQARVRGYITPEGAEMVQEVQRALQQIENNLTENMAFISSETASHWPICLYAAEQRFWFF